MGRRPTNAEISSIQPRRRDPSQGKATETKTHGFRVEEVCHVVMLCKRLIYVICCPFLVSRDL